MVDYLFILAMIGLIPIHELGHWVIAKRLKWDPHFKILFIHGHKYLLAFGVVTNVKIEVNTPQEFFKAHNQLIAFSFMGSIFTCAYLYFLGMLNILGPLSASIGSTFFLSYGIWEALNCGDMDKKKVTT